MTDLINVGTFDGEPVEYSPSSQLVLCKDVKMFYPALKRFTESGMGRITINGDTSIVDKGSTYKIGCLEDTKVNFNKLKVKIEKIRNK